jgi:WD40 repeat protein
MNKFSDTFISYGRADSKVFATKLHDRLLEHGFKIWFDQNDIPLGVDFQNQIDDGIEKAHNFLFIIAPHSMNSPYCRKEIELALKRNKRIIPLLHVEQISRETWQQRNPQGIDAEWEAYKTKGLHSSFPNMHPEIGKINWVYFREGIDDFDKSLAGLLQLLERHKSYVHQHTSFLAKALEWERHQQQSRYLLVGEQRSSAQAWLNVRFKDEQPPCTPTDLHCEYITESIKNAHNLMTQVFLAYAYEDKPVMEKIRNSLRREGFTVWTNTTDIQTGEAFEKAIGRGIEQADNVVYLLSPEALQSAYCQQELNYALSLNKRIIPVQVRETDPQLLPSLLRELQYIDLTDNVKDEDYRLDENQLIKILHQDEAYYQQHKVLLVKALNWQRQNDNPSILLRGYNLRHSEAWWKTARHRQQHSPTSIQEEFITTSLQQPPASSLDVLISYSRADSELAHKLNDALQMQGKTTWFDQESIPCDVEVEQEIYQGIEACDNILFILSPDSVNSPDFRNEVEHAASLNKRFVTVLQREVKPAELHLELAKVQWIDFSQNETDFASNFSQLIRTLDTDREHVHHHTKWSQRALEWEQKDKNEDLLLRGNEFAVAQAWLTEAEQQNKRPPATDLQKEYITKSQAAIEADIKREKRRVLILKSLLGLVSTAFVAAVGASFVAFNQYQKAGKENLLVLSQKSDTLFSSNQVFDALLAGIVAARKLEQADWIKTDSHLRAAIATSLFNSFYWLKEKNQLEGHKSGVWGVSFSPNGKLIATSSADGSVKVWQADGTLRFTLEEHRGQVRDVAWSPDGEVLASASADRTVKLWRKDGVVLHEFKGHRDTVHGVSFSPDGQVLASGSADRTVKLWRRDGTLIATLTGHQDQVRDVAWSPDGQLIASASRDKTIKLWNRQGTEVATLKGHTGGVEGVDWSPDGQMIASASGDQTIKLWNRQGTEVATLRGHTSGVEDVRFNPDGQFIASAGDEGTVKLWNRDGSLLTTLKSHATSVTAIAFSPNGRMLATSSWDRSVKLWSLDKPNVQTLTQHKSLVRDVQFSPDGKVLASASSDKSVKLWNANGTLLTSFDNAHRGEVFDVSFSPDGATMATASADQTVKLWNWQQGIRQLTLEGHRGAVHSVSFSPDGKTIATASADRTMKLWNRQDGTLRETFAGHTDEVHRVAWSPNGKMLATASADKTVMLWNLDGIAAPPLRGHQDAVYSLTWSLDGKMLATASGDKTIKLWSKDGILLKTLTGHLDKVIDVSFSPDGRMIVSASADNTVKIWRLDGTEILTIKGHQGQVNSVSFRPDGKMLASADSNQRVILWNWELVDEHLLDRLLAQSCSWVKDYLQTNPNVDFNRRRLCNGMVVNKR